MRQIVDDLAIMLKKFITALIAISFLCALPWIALSGTFSDNFDDGDLTGWKPNVAVGISVVHQKLQLKGGDSLIVKVGEPDVTTGKSQYPNLTYRLALSRRFPGFPRGSRERTFPPFLRSRRIRLTVTGPKPGMRRSS